MSNSFSIPLPNSAIFKLTQISEAECKTAEELACEILLAFIKENYTQMSNDSSTAEDQKMKLGRGRGWVDGLIGKGLCTAHLTPEQEEFINVYCETSNITRSHFLNMAIDQYIAWIKDTNKKF